MNLFGKKKTEKVDANRIIIQLGETLTQLNKREEFLSSQLEKIRHEAVKSAKEKKRQKAFSLLRRCKLYQKQLDSLWKYQDNLSTQILSLESSITGKNVFNALKTGNEALKNNEINADKVSEIMDEVGELVGNLDEVSEILGTPLVQVDEDELSKELDELELEIDAMAEPKLVLPNVPTKSIKNPLGKKSEEEEIQELKAILN